MGIGSIVLLPWMQFYMDRTDWHTACRTLGLFLLVVLAPLALLQRRPGDMGLYPDGHSQTVAATAARSAAHVVDLVWLAIDWTLARAVHSARCWWIGCAILCGGFAWCAVPKQIALQHMPSPLLRGGELSQGLLGYGLTSVMGAILVENFQGRRDANIFGTVRASPMADSALGPWPIGVMPDVSGSYAPAFWIACGL